MTAVVLWAALGATASAGVESAGSVLKTAKAAIAAEAGVHVTFVARSSSTSKTEAIRADVGPTSGVETISVGQARLAVRVTPPMVCQREFLGADDALRAELGRRQEGRCRLGVVADRLQSVLGPQGGCHHGIGACPASEDPRHDAVDRGRRRRHPLRLEMDDPRNQLRTQAVEPAHRLGGGTLPAEATSIASGGTKATTTLSGWGEQILVNAPPIASTIASSAIAG